MNAISALSTTTNGLPTRESAVNVAQQFEELFAQQMISGMRRSMQLDGEEGGMFGSGPGADTYAQWFDSMMSEKLGEGRGLGLRDTLLRHWDERGLIEAARPGGVASATEVIHATA